MKIWPTTRTSKDKTTTSYYLRIWDTFFLKEKGIELGWGNIRSCYNFYNWLFRFDTYDSLLLGHIRILGFDCSIVDNTIVDHWRKEKYETV